MLYVIIIDDACRRGHLFYLCFLGARFLRVMTSTNVIACSLGLLALHRRLPSGLNMDVT